MFDCRLSAACSYLGGRGRGNTSARRFLHQPRRHAASAPPADTAAACLPPFPVVADEEAVFATGFEPLIGQGDEREK
jgi:hypothetical protein